MHTLTEGLVLLALRCRAITDVDKAVLTLKAQRKKLAEQQSLVR